MRGDPMTLEEQIMACIASGAVLELDYDRLILRVEDATKPVVHVDVTLDLPLGSIYQMTGVMQAADLLGLLPRHLLPTGVLSLATVSFTLDTAAREVTKISATIGFGPTSETGYDGVPWRIASIGTKALSVTLRTLTLGLSAPGKEDEEHFASAAGTTDIAALKLLVSGSYPEGEITISQPQGASVDLGAFLADFGVERVGFLDRLALEDLDAMVLMPTESGTFASRLSTREDAPVILLPGSEGPPALLALDQVSFRLAFAPGLTDVSLAAALLVRERLVFDAKASYGPGGAWMIAGEVNVPATWQRLNAGKPLPDDCRVTLRDLVRIFAPGHADHLPEVLPDAGIATLAARYSHNNAASTAYRLRGVFDGRFALDGLTAVLTVDLSEANNTVAAAFDMHGFLFTLSYTFNADEPPSGTLSAAIQTTVHGRLLKVLGSHDAATSTITLRLDSEVSLAVLITWFVGSVTGKKRFELAEPWHAILDRVELPRNLAFEMNTQTRVVKATVGGLGASFPGFSIDSFSLRYDPAARSDTHSGLSFEITGSLPGGTTLKWDPAQEAPPKLPGQGASVLQIRTAAVGQHFAFAQGAPDSVEEAVSHVRDALLPANWKGRYPDTMRFDQNAGWLFGAHARVLEQADLQFIFNDPDIYGVVLRVERSGKDTKLNILAGLYASILYRKVTETVGVYEGALILPDKVKSMNFGAFEITLPSFHLAIYTNGDFRIDVGFPSDLDFSNSMALKAGIYSGAAGFYYARLSGLSPKALPQVPEDIGVFSPVTQLGIGLELGIRRGFRSGPLTARVALVVQGVFEGTFATYTRYSDGAQDEFHDARATVAIFGQLTGEVDFAIIKARLAVTVFLRADVALRSHLPTVLTYSVRVDIDLTVSVSLGLFTVHIHLSFNMRVDGSETFGAHSTALWDTGARRGVLAAVAVPPAVWQAIAPTGGPRALTAYFIPQLTAGEDYTEAVPPETPVWFYTGQLALSNPAGAAQPGTAGDPSFFTFVEGALRWAFLAASGQGSAEGAPVPQDKVDAVPIGRDALAALLEGLADGSARPDTAALRGFFKAGFATQIVKPATGAAGEPLAVGFFPVLPGMTVSIRAGAQPERQMRHGARLGAGASIATPVEEVLSDFILVILRSGLQAALDRKDLFEGAAPTIGTLLAALSGSFASIAGLTSRFMLHGTRRPEAEGSGDVPLYALTGQQEKLSAEDLAASDLTVSLNFATPDQAAWGVTLEGGAASLPLSSAGPAPVVIAPPDMPESPTLEGRGVTVTPSRTFITRELHFGLGAGIAAGSGKSLWHLPPDLTARLISSGAEGINLALREASDTDPDAEGTAVQATAFNWALSLDFDVSRIPLGGQAEAHLGNTYALQGVTPRGLKLLQALIEDQGARIPQMQVEALSLGYRTPAAGAESVTLFPVDFVSTFLVQANFSTETRPPLTATAPKAAAADPAQVLSFIGKLWSSGVTNSGGYFLYTGGLEGKGLPEALFAGRAPATLSLVIRFAAPAGDAPAPVAGFVNAVLGTGLELNGSYYVQAPDFTQDYALIRPGLLSLDITRPEPVPTADVNSTLNQLYSLYGGRIVGVSGSDTREVFGPTKSARDGKLQYAHAFALTEATPDPSAPDVPILPESANPYRFVGSSLRVSLRRVDLFGNLWTGSDDGPDMDITYHDPLIHLTRLPYLRFDFSFAAGPSPQIVIATSFTPPSYLAADDNTDTAEDRKASDLAAYAAAYFQLAEVAGAPRVDAAVLTSLTDEKPLAIDAVVLARNLKAAYEMIRDTAILASAAATPANAVPLEPITARVDSSALTARLLTPLTVDLSIARKGPCAEDIAASSPVRAIRFAVPPRQVAETEGGPVTLQAFNQGFKQAFAGQDRALATGGHSSATGTGNRQIWVVRHGRTGIDPRIDARAEPNYFAPRPLSNTLISRDVMAQTLDAAGVLSAGYDQRLAARDVDLDAEMRKFIAAIDDLFSPRQAIPAALIAPEALNEISAGKRVLVEKLVPYVTRLERAEAAPETSADNHAAAVDRYRQECLIKLGNFYDMVSVTVVRLTTALGGQSPEPALRVHGQPVFGQTSEQDLSFSITGGKAEMDPSGCPIAFGLFASDKMRRSSFAADLSLHLTAIEFDIETVTLGDASFTSGSWLKLIDPIPPLAIGAVDIPIPLRVFPTPPDLQAQTARPLAVTTLPEDAAQAIALAKTWALEAAFQHPFVAQDRVDVLVRINTDTAEPLRFAGAGRDLVDELVSFNALYPALKALFDDKDLAAIRTPEQAREAPELAAALRAMAALTKAVVAAPWTSESTANRMASPARSGLAERSCRYALRDGVQSDAGGRWQSEVSIAEQGAQPLDLLPELRIPQYTTELVSRTATSAVYQFTHTESGAPLSAQEGLTLRSRVLALRPHAPGAPFGSPLNVIDRQNGQIAMKITRNARLQAAFQYATEWISHAAPLVPLLDIGTAINIAGLARGHATSAAPLLDHLTALVAAILTGSGTGDRASGYLRVAASFEYPIVAQASSAVTLPLVVLPVLLQVRTEVTLGPAAQTASDVVGPMADFIEGWLKDNGLTPEARPDLWPLAKLVFDISVFSSGASIGQPILLFRRLELPVAAVQL